MVADEVLWSKEDARLELARGILHHALQREPSRAVAKAFVARYQDVLDDDGQGWVITYSGLQDWLSQIGVRG